MTRATWAALAVVAAGAFLGSWVVLGHLWYGSTPQIVDTGTYEHYGDAMAAGQVPYRDFRLEYPPGALLPFLAPELTARSGDSGSYDHAFERWMAGAGVLLVLFVAGAIAALRASPARAIGALAVVAFSPLLVGTVVLTRFDLWVAALTATALAALLAGLDLPAAIVLGLAIGTKLYPAVLVPLGVAWIWRQRGRRQAVTWCVALVATCAAVFLPFAAIAPGGVGHSFGEQLGRPLQIESLGAAILIALHHVAGLGVVLHSDHGSQNVQSSGAHAIALGTTLLEAAALVAIWIAFARGAATRERLVVAAAASVTAFMAFGKVFSPQFMIWLVAVVPLVRNRAAWALLVAALVLTQLWFPAHYWPLTTFRPRESWLVLARDLVVVALAAVLYAELSPVRGFARRRAGSPAAPRAAA